MRHLYALALALFAVCAIGRPADAKPTTSLDLKAESVTYYSNRFLVTADGLVRVRLSDGTIVRGATFAMDLKLNRFIVAGGVTLDSPLGNVHETGAAFAGYLDLDLSYFLTEGATPDRWSFFGLDFTKPLKGRQQPGDAFYLPDVGSDRPYIYASSATILPRNNILFKNSRVHVLAAYVPTGSFAVSFSANSAYAQNSLSGATAGVGLPFAASKNALSTLGLRYDPVNRFYLSFQENLVHDRDYLVFSVNPITRELRQTNLIGYEHFSPNAEARVFLQLTTLSHGFSEPEVSTAYENLTSNVAVGRIGTLSLSADNYNTSLLPPSPVTPNEQSFDKPSDAQIAFTSHQYAIKNTPVAFTYRTGLGLAHDAYNCGVNAQCPSAANGFVDQGYVLDRFGATMTPVGTIWQHFLGFNVFSRSVYLNNADKAHSISLSAIFDKQRQWFSLPHHIDTTSTTISASRIYGTKLALLEAYSVINTGDNYGARQLEFYPAYGTIVTPTGIYNGYNAFRGFTTTRALTTSVVFTPNQFFATNLTFRRSYDFPAPIPYTFGEAPYQLSADVRVRISRQVLLDVSRTYSFNFSGITYSPGFLITFGP